MDYVFSDPHFGHGKIIEYCNRPFKTVQEMDDTIIRNINDLVTPDDRLLCLGDFTFRDPHKYLGMINCKNISLVPGNHDRWVGKVRTMMEILPLIHVINGYAVPVVVCHYPIHSWPHKFHDSLHLYGHIHNNEDGPEGNAVNVCVEHTGYKPVRIDKLVLDCVRNRLKNMDLDAPRPRHE